MLLSSEEFTQLKCGAAVSPITDFELYGKTSHGSVISYQALVERPTSHSAFRPASHSFCIFRALPWLKDRLPSVHGKAATFHSQDVVRVHRDGVRAHLLGGCSCCKRYFPLVFPSDGKFGTQSRSASAEAVFDNPPDRRR